jgi:alpha-2-macroglobulin-like protein
MSTFSEPSSSQKVLKPTIPAARPSNRAVKWLVALAAFCLVSISVAGYFYHRYQMAAIAGEYLRLLVIGPSTLHTGVRAQFDISTTQVTGTPLSMPVEVDLYSPDGKRILGQKVTSDTEGRLQFVIPADMSLPGSVTLKVAASHNGVSEQMTAPLDVYSVQQITRLSLDKPLFQPGETVLYRSLTLSQFSLTVDREVSVHFEIIDPSGNVLAKSQFDATTDRGVCSGSYAIPDDLPGGQYALVARSINGSFHEAMQKFFVRRYRQPRVNKELVFLRESYAPGEKVEADFTAKRADGKPASAARLRVLAVVDGKTVLEKNEQTDGAGALRIDFKLPDKIERGDGQLTVVIDEGGAREATAKTIPISLEILEVNFFPECGDLVAGLENRVYFICRDSLDRPVNISGVVVNENDQIITAVETLYNGMGQFSITPRAGITYRLKIIAPAGVEEEPKLPPAKTDCPIVLSTGTGVFGASEPLEFNIRSTKADVPLVVCAWRRGVLVGQMALVTRKNGTNPVVLFLPDNMGGVIRITAFDYGINPDQSDPQAPKPLVERLVYRRSDRRLNVNAADKREHYSPGEKVNINLTVTNEKNEPTAAVLGVSVVDKILFALVDDHTPSLTTYFLLTSDIENPDALEDADFYLSGDKTSPVSSATALDLLLGTQGRPFTQKNEQRSKEQRLETARFANTTSLSGPSSPPMLSDNLGRIRKDYEKNLAAYHSDRSQILYTTISVSFLASWGLLVLVMMLGLFRIVKGASFWLPVLSTVACSALIGALLTNHQRISNAARPIAPFLPYQAPDSKSAVKSAAETLKKPAEVKSAEKSDARLSGSGQGVVSPSGQGFQLEQLIDPDKYRRDFTKTLYWKPLMIAGPDGKASLSFSLPDSISTYRLSADAHGDGRIGSARIDVSTQKAGKSD